MHQGKYYLFDVGYMVRSGLIAPYRGVHYHLKEYSSHPLENYREVFDLRHASLRNAVERAFGVLKKRFPIIGNHVGYQLHHIIEANPSAKKWRHTPIINYEKLVDLFSKDRATSAGVETAKENRKRWDNRSRDDYETVEGIDQLLSQNEVTLESFDR
ncbi:hypothetical protein Dsin_008236 [Dipteronia sinensis]|uniref:DDE Tnp4 domain-containing protein n=1 Tax=Dipteronia sinensis TaxID=43782 RepID=A0AAE0EAK5_9ROSI|nr:hypothetical protein Dsin_008236 [Dipteronia sinensis]